MRRVTGIGAHLFEIERNGEVEVAPQFMRTDTRSVDFIRLAQTEPHSV